LATLRAPAPAIAFGQAAPLVDGNVARVFARIFGIRSDVTKPGSNRSLRWVSPKDLARLILPAAHRRALRRIFSAQR